MRLPEECFRIALVEYLNRSVPLLDGPLASNFLEYLTDVEDSVRFYHGLDLRLFLHIYREEPKRQPDASDWRYDLECRFVTPETRHKMDIADFCYRELPCDPEAAGCIFVTGHGHGYRSRTPDDVPFRCDFRIRISGKVHTSIGGDDIQFHERTIRIRVGTFDGLDIARKYKGKAEDPEGHGFCCQSMVNKLFDYQFCEY